MEKKKIICDTDFLCSFLWTSSENVLIKLLKKHSYELYVPDAVKTEIEVLER